MKISRGCFSLFTFWNHYLFGVYLNGNFCEETDREMGIIFKPRLPLSGTPGYLPGTCRFRFVETWHLVSIMLLPEIFDFCVPRNLWFLRVHSPPMNKWHNPSLLSQMYQNHKFTHTEVQVFWNFSLLLLFCFVKLFIITWCKNVKCMKTCRSSLLTLVTR